MKHVRVHITAGGREAEIHPMYDLWANAPFIERASALQWNYTGDALGILHYAVGDADAFERAVGGVSAVVDYDLLRTGGEAFYVYIRDETTDALGDLLAPVMAGGVIAIPPIRYEDGTVTFSLFGPDAEIQAAIEAVGPPVEVTVEAISGLETVPSAAETRLSERQREATEAAVALGYYDVPRGADHEDIAAALGCAPSTAAEHLRKAESKLLPAIMQGPV